MKRDGYRLDGRKSIFRLPSGPVIRKLAVGFIIAIWVILLVVSYATLAKRNITAVRSQNAARLQALKGDIAALPTVNSIAPAHTSQNMSYVIQSRQDLVKKISAKTYAPRKPNVIFSLDPAYYSSTEPFAAHNKAILVIKLQLQNSADTMKGLQKFVEYMPVIDLADNLDYNPTRVNHLARTQEGLRTTAQFLQDRSLHNNTEIATAIIKLSNTATSLSDATKLAWTKEVFIQQQDLLASLVQYDIQNGNFANALETTAHAYQ